MDNSYYSQLTAEVFDRRHNRWTKIRPRNEALDCTIYGIAAAMQPKWRIHLWTEQHWAKIENQTARSTPPPLLKPAEPTPAPPARIHESLPPLPVPSPAPKPKPRGNTSFINRPAGQSWNPR